LADDQFFKPGVFLKFGRRDCLLPGESAGQKSYGLSQSADNFKLRIMERFNLTIKEHYHFPGKVFERENKKMAEAGMLIFPDLPLPDCFFHWLGLAEQPWPDSSIGR
jgi:hypothetical protein